MRAALFAVLATAALACGRGLPPPEERAIPARLPAAERPAARRLALEGAHNFRDLGGYATRDGRHVRWGSVYRSDDLSELSDADVAFVERLELRLAVDLRSREEREREPDRLPSRAAPRVVLMPIHGRGIDPAELRRRIQSADLEGVDFAELLIGANRELALEFAGTYGELLQELGAPDALPALVHCTAGKDRTGFAAAALLLALGVPRDAIYEDYLLSDGYLRDPTTRRLRLAWVGSFFRLDTDALRPLFEARREYLEAAFAAIDARFGSDDAYLREGLRLSDELVARLRASLLE